DRRKPLRGLSLYPRIAGPGSAHPDQRRNTHQQFSALAIGLHRNVLHADPLARFSTPRGVARPPRLPAPRAPIRQDARSNAGTSGRGVQKKPDISLPTLMKKSGFADRRRVYSALVFLPCFYILVRYLPPFLFFVFVGVGILLAQYEYYRLHFPSRSSPSLGMGLTLGILVTATFAVPGHISGQALVTL